MSSAVGAVRPYPGSRVRRGPVMLQLCCGGARHGLGGDSPNVEVIVSMRLLKLGGTLGPEVLWAEAVSKH